MTMDDSLAGPSGEIKRVNFVPKAERQLIETPESQNLKT